MTRSQRTLHTRAFALLTPLLVIAIALACLRSALTRQALTMPNAAQTSRSAP